MSQTHITLDRGRLGIAMQWLAGFVTAIAFNVTTQVAAIDSLLVLDAGEAIEARLADISSSGHFVVTSAGQERRVEPSSIVNWGRCEPIRQGPLILFRDGSLWAADVVELDASAIMLQTPYGLESKHDRHSVKATITRLPPRALDRQRQLDRWRELRESQDFASARNGDRFTGTVFGDRYQPQAETDFPLQWRIERSGAVHPILLPWENVAGVVLKHPLPVPSPDTLPKVERSLDVWFGFREGSRLLVRRMRRVDDDVILELANGSLISLPISTVLDRLTFVQSISSPVVFLSDMGDLDYRYVPDVGGDWQFQRDRNVLGGEMIYRGEAFIKGMGMHSTSRLAVNLNSEYSQFSALAAIDDDAPPQASVQFRVFVERIEGAEATWAVAFESPVVRNGDSAVQIDIDVRDALRMALIVDEADGGQTGDHANWLNARLLRPTNKPHD